MRKTLCVNIKGDIYGGVRDGARGAVRDELRNCLADLRVDPLSNVTDVGSAASIDTVDTTPGFFSEDPLSSINTSGIQQLSVRAGLRPN